MKARPSSWSLKLNGSDRSQRIQCHPSASDVVAYLVLVLLALGVLASAIRIMREYERAVVFTLGRFSGVRGPGLIILIPFVQQLVRIDLRTIVLHVPTRM